MGMKMNPGRRCWPACLLALGLALLAGCSGNSGSPVADSSPLAPAAGTAESFNPAQLATLPSPAEIARMASLIPTQLSCDGSVFRADLPHQNVAADGNAALFSPGSGGGGGGALSEAAFAIYNFDLSNFAAEFVDGRFVLRAGIPLQTSPPASVYAGLGNPDRNQWHWVELQPEDTPEPLYWSWGQSNPTTVGPGSEGSGAGRTSPFLPVVIVMFGGNEVAMESLELLSADQPPAGGVLSFRKGWDGTIKGYTRFDGSTDVDCDDQGRVHVTYYDSSAGQLFHMMLQNRVWTTRAVDCDGDVGLSHDLLYSSAHGLLLPYVEQDNFTGAIKWMAPENIQDMIWSPRSNFETGFDDGGLAIQAGGHPSSVWDDTDIVHVFYECATSGRIRHAWRLLGLPDWLHEYVSPEGLLAGRPVALNYSGGVCVVYMSEGKLYLAQQGADGWLSDELADDVYNPIDPESPIGFCDAEVREDTAVIAMACTGGQRLLRFEIPERSLLPEQNQIFNSRPGGGAFIDLAVMGDGSVRIAQFNTLDRRIYFETGDKPTAEQFTSVPAVQYGGGEDCDDLRFYIDDDDDGDGWYDAVLVELSSKQSPLTSSRRTEFKGHVTLIR